MKNRLILMIALIVGALLIAYMFAFQVRYDEVAIKTVFDEVKYEIIIVDPGLHFRLPWPINDVTKYTKRVQLLEDTLRYEQTKDS